MDDGFDWIRNISYEPGDFFTDKEICYNNRKCDVNITEDSFIFTLTIDDMISEFISEDKGSLKKALLSDYRYEINHKYLNETEFNYTLLTVTQIVELQKINNSLGGAVSVSNLYTNNELYKLNDFYREYGTEEMMNLFSELVNDVVYHMEYFLNVNSLDHVKNEFVRILDLLGVEHMFFGEMVRLTIPNKLIHEHMANTNNLTDTLSSVLSVLDIDWFGVYTEVYDISGSSRLYTKDIDLFINTMNEIINEE